MTRLPAEWEPQSAVFIAWPCSDGDFKNLTAVEQNYSFIAQTISRFQRLIILCRNAKHEQHIRSLLEPSKAVHYCHAEYKDIWLRDTLFLTVEHTAQARLLNFRFNGWGNKYPHTADNALNQQLLSKNIFSSPQHIDIDFILEGGSIESDGQGTLLTTSNCLLNPNRNPGLNRDDIQRKLQQVFGCTRILWLQQPNLAGDDTDAHIDTLARFCDAETIAYTCCNRPDDPHYQSLQYMELQLKALHTAKNTPYKLIDLPLPSPIFDKDGLPLPANYANFLIINQAVMVPVYDDPNDQIALSKLASCFPGREIIATPCRAIVHQYGSLHCMTMHFPATVSFSV